MKDRIREILLSLVDLKTIIAFLLGLAISVVAGLSGVSEKDIRDELCKPSQGGIINGSTTSNVSR